MDRFNPHAKLILLWWKQKNCLDKPTEQTWYWMSRGKPFLKSLLFSRWLSGPGLIAGWRGRDHSVADIPARLGWGLAVRVGEKCAPTPTTFKKYFLILCVWVFWLHLCMCTTRMPGAHRGHKRPLNSLELDLQTGAVLWMLRLELRSSASAASVPSLRLLSKGFLFWSCLVFLAFYLPWPPHKGVFPGLVKPCQRSLEFIKLTQL